MKKTSFFATLLGVLLMGASPVAADSCTPCWTPDCCDWSLCDGKFKISGDWLYWQAAQDNIICANLETSTADLNTFTTIRPGRNYESGYRVELGYELPDCCWEVGVSYFNLPSNSSSSAVAGLGQSIVISDDVLPARITSLTSLTTKWNLNINQIDVDFARNICFGECFSLRPHAGFRAIWGDQKAHIDGVTTFAQVGDTTFVDAYSSKWSAYGVEAGFDARWKFGCGLAIVGKAGGSLLYSKFTNHSSFTVVTQPTESTLVSSVAPNNYWAGLPTMEYFLGLEYDDSFCDMAFNIHAGWEQHFLFSLNRFSQCGAHGNLSIQGLTLGLGLTF